MSLPVESVPPRLRKDLLLALLTAVAVVLGALESALPSPLPWVRLGLANAASLLALVLWGLPEALGVTLVRVLLGVLVGGGLGGPAFLLSLGGGVAAVLAMGALRAARIFGLLGMSAAGSWAHTLTQFGLLAILLGGNGAVLGAAPPFLLLSLPAGLAVGWLADAGLGVLARASGVGTGERG